MKDTRFLYNSGTTHEQARRLERVLREAVKVRLEVEPYPLYHDPYHPMLGIHGFRVKFAHQLLVGQVSVTREEAERTPFELLVRKAATEIVTLLSHQLFIAEPYLTDWFGSHE